MKPRTRPGWVELEEGTWVRVAAVTAILAENLPEPAENPDEWIITIVRAGGEALRSIYTTTGLLDAIAEAEAEAVPA